ncbi:hypothetical protein BH09PSE2_BH09PSE2_11820 [soil metagenome]
MPIVLFPRLLLQLVSIAVLAVAAYLVWSWWRGYDVISADGVVEHVHAAGWMLWTGVGLFALSLGAGRMIVLLLLRKGGEPEHRRSEARTVEAPDGSVLHVEATGPVGAPLVILTHGWGLNSTAWGETRRALSDRFRVVVWDLPGLGRSKGPRDGVYSLDRFAEALAAVARSEGQGPVVLVGHSIGGMTTQTFFRAAPQDVRSRVVGAVLFDTTYEDPIRTMWLSPLWRALKVPLIKPLMHVVIWLSPLVWLSSWQGYLSGMNHVVMRLTGFGRFATRGQVELTARLASKGSPAVQAKGNLAMLRWSVAETLPEVTVPLLILAGSKDIVTLPAASRTIAAAVPKGRLVEVEGCGHMGFMERADVYNAALVEFAEARFAAAA